jgi:hypothetical protein
MYQVASHPNVIKRERHHFVPWFEQPIHREGIEFKVRERYSGLLEVVITMEENQVNVGDVQ